MSTVVVKKKKWYRRLFSYFRRHKRTSPETTLENSDKLVFFFKNKFELRLHEENLLYRRSGCNDHPALNIGIGLTERDLCGKPSPYMYYNTYLHSGQDLFIHPGFEKVIEEVYYDEPIIDGLPATLWLECIEPTLALLSSISTLKHRKSNLVMKKPRPTTRDSHFSRHGDFEMGVIEMLSRRLNVALNGSLREIQQDISTGNNAIARRQPNRHRNERDDYALLNINQSANSDDESTCLLESNSSVGQDHLDPDIPSVIEQEEADDELLLEDFESLDEWELPEKYNPAYNQLTGDSGHERSSREEKVNCTERSTAEIHDQKTASRSRKKSKRRRSTKANPQLYFWKPEIREFEKMELRNYPLNTLMLIKCGVKYYFQVEDKQNENELCNRLTYLSRMDFFTRRLIMSQAEDLFNKTAAHEISNQELENAEKFLQLKGISPKYETSKLAEDTEANYFELPTKEKGFFRKKMNSVLRMINEARQSVRE